MEAKKAQAESYRSIVRITGLGIILLLFCFLFIRNAEAATLKIIQIDSPATETQTFRASVEVDAQGTAINAAESTVTFPAAYLEITSLSQAGIFDHWAVGPTYANPSGTLQFAGGLPSPGYSGSAGTILTITFRAKQAGTAQICPTSSRILANDGSGTNVFSANICLTVNISAYPLPPVPSISSTTHPDQTLWYAQREVALSWDAGSGITGYSHIFDATPTTVPDTISEGTDQQAAIIATSDGVWYFHVRALNAGGWGSTGHFKISIDSTPPTISASLFGSSPTTDTTPDFSYVADDSLSGVARVEVVIDGTTTIPLPLSQSLATLPELAVGLHSIIVRAFDQAANTAETSFVIEIQAPVIPPPVEPPPKTVINKIVDTITDIVPQPIKNVIKNVAKPVADVIKDIRANEGIVNRTKEIAQPIAESAAIISVAAAAAALPASMLNAVLNFFRFFYLIFSPIFVRRKRKAWGTVVDSVTGKPLKGVVVRIFETEFNKMKESQITDDYGRFGFLVDPGTYTISADKQGYKFPSTLFEHLMGLPNIYTGGKITVTDKIHHNINVTIPVDPDLSHISAAALAWKRVRDVASLILERLNLPLLVIGSGVSVWANIVVPTTLNHLLLGLYVLLIILKLIRDKSHFRSYGEVFEAETKKPLGLVVIRVFDAKRSVVVATRISNQQGKFEILVRPGNYYLMATKPPYQAYRSPVLTISRAKAIALDIYMEKLAPKPSASAAQNPPAPAPPTIPPTQTPAAPSPAQPSAPKPPVAQSVLPQQAPALPQPEQKKDPLAKPASQINEIKIEPKDPAAQPTLSPESPKDEQEKPTQTS